MLSRGSNNRQANYFGESGRSQSPMTRKSKAARKRAKPAKEEPLLNKMGRPLSIADRDQAKKILGGLGAIQASWKEAAAVLNMHESTLGRMFQRWPDVKDAFDSAKLGGVVGLKRNQFKLAEKNATMAIFLGMNYAGQKDMRATVHSGDVKHSHEHSIVGMMLKEIDNESRGKPAIEHRKDEGKTA